MIEHLGAFKWLMAAVIFVVTWISGIYPFIRRFKCANSESFPNAEALGSGIFLGAGLIHLLPDAARSFREVHVDYPWAFLLAGSVLLVLLWLEHIGKELVEHGEGGNGHVAILAMLMLSLHSFLAGAVLGVSNSLELISVIGVALLAHKWAESFALAVELNGSNLSFRASSIAFAIFTIMVPLGIALGHALEVPMSVYPYAVPVLISLAAGTFIYLGTLHGLKSGGLASKCCNLKQFTYVIFGFALMAVVALWL